MPARNKAHEPGKPGCILQGLRKTKVFALSDSDPAGGAMPVSDINGSTDPKEPDDTARLLGRCVGEVIGGGLVAAVVMVMASGLGWLADLLEEHVHKATFTHQAFELMGDAGIVLGGTLSLILVVVALFKLIRDMLK
jgi:hypothetical protein